jgi:pseudaminic acid cytidylyltransferase
MSKLCIIPARGGSKRIPGKNIRNFLGKPIIAYTIEAALDSRLFDKVMVSTDDEKIAEISNQYGAEVPFLRSASASDDFATTAQVITEVLKQYEHNGVNFDYACCCYATSPFTTSIRLKEGFLKLIEENPDSVYPITAFTYPIFRSLKKLDNGRVGMIWPENRTKRSQDFPKAFHDAGQWYWFVVDIFLKSKNLLTNNSIGLEISPMEVQDLDNEYDWHLAELKYSYIKSFK